MCLVLTEGKRKEEEKVKGVTGKEMKKKMHPFYMFGRTEEKEKNKKEYILN